MSYSDNIQTNESSCYHEKISGQSTPSPRHNQILSHSKLKSAAFQELKKNRIEVFEDYKKRKNIENELQEAFQAIISEEELHSNPYFPLLTHMRHVELKYTNYSRKDITVNQNTLEDENSNIITCVVGENQFWGLSQIIKRIDVEALTSLLRLMKSSYNIISENKTTEETYQVHQFTCLVGRSVFYGSLFPHLRSLKIEHHFFIQGPNFEKAINIYAKNIMKDIFESQTSGKVLILGITVVIPSRNKKEKGNNKLFTSESLRSSKKIFISALKAAIVAKNECFYEGVIRVTGPGKGLNNSNYSYFIPCQKNYILSYAVDNNNPYRPFIENPERCLQEGLFFSKDSAKLYYQIVDTSLQKDQTFYQESIVQAQYNGDHREAFESLFYYYMIISEEASNSMLFKLSDMIQQLPSELYSITISSRTLIQSIELCQNLITLIGIQMSKTGKETGAITNNSGAISPTSLKLITTAIQEHYDQYRFRLRRIVGGNETSYFSGLQDKIEYNLSQISLLLPLQLSTIRPVTHPISPFVSILELLEELNAFTSSVVLSLARDIAIDVAKEDKHNMDPYDQNFSNTAWVINNIVKKNTDREKEPLTKQQQKALIKQLKKKEIPPEVGYNIESSDWKNNPNRKVINIKREMKKSLIRMEYPQAIAREANYLRYLTDARVDYAIQHILADVLLHSMPINPYPFFSQKISIFYIRHQLFKVGDYELIEKYKENEIQQSASTKGLIHFVLTGEKNGILAFYGRPISLMLLDINYALRLADKTKKIIGVTIDSTGSSCTVKVASSYMCSELNQSNFITRRYASKIKIVEHIIIEGPHIRKALELFTDGILYDILRMIDLPGVYVLNVAFGEGAEDWSHECKASHLSSTIKSKKDAFRHDIQKYIHNKEPIVLRGLFLQGEKYVPLLKFYVFYFIKSNLDEFESYAPSRLPFKDECIFLSLEMAYCIFRNENEESKTAYHVYSNLLKEQIHQHAERGDFLECYRSYLSWQLGNKSKDENVSSVMRIWKSPAARIYEVESDIETVVTAVHSYLTYDEARHHIDINIIHQQLEKTIDTIKPELDPLVCIHLPGIRCKIFEMTKAIQSQWGKEKPNFSRENILQLREIRGLLKALRYSISHDIHYNCLEMVQFVNKKP